MEKMERKGRIMKINGGIGLPSNIVKVIFSKLGIFNLHACRLVSKIWNDMVIDYASSCKFVSHANFIVSTFEICPPNCNCNCNRVCRTPSFCNAKMHSIDMHNMSFVASFGFHDRDCSMVYIYNSCNGLLFISKSTGGDADVNGILNPMTNEFFELYVNDEEDSYAYGFGFSPNTKQYKLFRASTDREEYTCTMEIMRLGGRSGTKEWRHFDCFPFDIHYCGAYLNGVIYWIGKEKGKEFVIYTLDVETEKIESIATLEVGPYGGRAYIGTFNANVFACVPIVGPCCKKFQLWMMQGKDSWIREFVMYDVPKNLSTSFFHLIKVLENGERWFFLNGKIFCCDKTGTNVKIKSIFNQNTIRFGGFFPIESLNFGSLQNILAGDE